MSLPTFSGQMGIFDVQNLLGRQFAPDDRYRLFADLIYPRLVAARPALLQAYCQDNGRPGLEPVLLLGVSLLQYLEDCPDRAAVQMLQYHLGWKLALQQPLGLESFNASSLSNFRQRLAEHGLDKLAFNSILQGLEQAGLVAKQGPRRLDSTHVLGRLKRMSRLELLRETLRLSLEEWAALADLPRPPSWPTLWERYVESKLDYKLADATLAQKQMQAGEDMLLLAQWAKGQAAVAGLAQVQLLQRVLVENFAVVEGQLQVIDQPAGAVRNPHEPEATWTKKGDKSTQWEGYKAQVVETVPPQPAAQGQPTQAFITAIVTQEAIGSEDAGLELSDAEQQQSGLEPAEQTYVDGGYISGRRLHEAQEAGRELIGPAKDSSQVGVFRTDEFEVQVEQRRATCPAAHQASHCQSYRDGRSGEVRYRFDWGEACATCPLKDQCIKKKDGKQAASRSLDVTEHHSYLQQRRREQETAEFKQRMRQRNAIEGTISELVRAHDLRHARYRGLEKVRQQNYFIGAACNAKRWLALAAWRMAQAALGALEQVQAALNGPVPALAVN